MSKTTITLTLDEQFADALETRIKQVRREKIEELSRQLGSKDRAREALEAPDKAGYISYLIEQDLRDAGEHPDDEDDEDDNWGLSYV